MHGQKNIKLFLVISRSIRLRMKKKSHTNFRETRNTNFMFKIIFSSKMVLFMIIMRKHRVERGRPQMTIWHMRIPCWIPKATNKHTDYVIALPL